MVLLSQGVSASQVGSINGEGAPSGGRRAMVCGPWWVRAGPWSLSSSLHRVGAVVLQGRPTLRDGPLPGRAVHPQHGHPGVLQLGIGQGHVAVPPLVPGAGHLGVDPHLLLVGLRLDRVAGQVGVAPVAGLVLLLPPLSFILVSALHLLVILLQVLWRMPVASPAGVPIIHRVGVVVVRGLPLRPHIRVIGGRPGHGAVQRGILGIVVSVVPLVVPPVLISRHRRASLPK